MMKKSLTIILSLILIIYPIKIYALEIFDIHIQFKGNSAIIKWQTNYRTICQFRMGRLSLFTPWHKYHKIIINRLKTSSIYFFEINTQTEDYGNLQYTNSFATPEKFEGIGKEL